MEELTNVPIANSSSSIEQMPFVEPNSNPFDDNIDWYHMYCKITDEVLVGYPSHSDPDYIIVCHVPTGLRIKVRFNEVESQSMIEILSQLPRTYLERSK